MWKLIPHSKHINNEHFMNLEWKIQAVSVFVWGNQKSWAILISIWYKKHWTIMGISEYSKPANHPTIWGGGGGPLTRHQDWSPTDPPPKISVDRWTIAPEECSYVTYEERKEKRQQKKSVNKHWATWHSKSLSLHDGLGATWLCYIEHRVCSRGENIVICIDRKIISDTIRHILLFLLQFSYTN